MKWLWKIIKWLLLLALATTILLLLNFAYFHWRGPTEAQLNALQRAEAGTPKPRGRNAFALMWLFNKDIADEELEQVAAEDVKFAEENSHNLELIGEFPSARLPVLAEPAARSKLLCRAQEAECLTRVRANPESTREELARHPRLLARATQLEDYDYLRNEFPPILALPFSYFRSAHELRLSSLALAYVDGRREEALAGACRNLGVWRNFGRENPSLILSMLAVARRDDSMQLIAGMLAGLEPGVALPESCRDAFSPVVAEEVSMCAPMIGEFEISEKLLERAVPESGLTVSVERAILTDPQYRAWRAQKTIASCGSTRDEQLLQDHLVDRAIEKINRLECAANPVGCILVEIAAPGYVDYEARLLDSAAHLRLVATLAWLRENPGDARPLEIRFTERPASLHSGTRATGISDDGRSVWVENFYQRRDQRFILPLATGMTNSP